MTLRIRRAIPSDIPSLARLMRANRDDVSLFQQSKAQLTKGIDNFYVALLDGHVVGAAALVRRANGRAEITGVAVAPSQHGCGIGSGLVTHIIAVAQAERVRLLWLGTAKPAYFARFGFRPMTRWRLPLHLLLYKLTLVFAQPVARWIPAIFGGHVFMSLCR